MVKGEGALLEEAFANILNNAVRFTPAEGSIELDVHRHEGTGSVVITISDTGEGIRIKVEDGVIVFPYAAMGEPVSAEGIFEAVPLTPEQVAARTSQEQKPESHSHPPGEPCDKGLPAKTGCDVPVQDNTVYLIRGTGAVIYS